MTGKSESIVGVDVLFARTSTSERDWRDNRVAKRKWFRRVVDGTYVIVFISLRIFWGATPTSRRANCRRAISDSVLSLLCEKGKCRWIYISITCRTGNPMFVRLQIDVSNWRTNIYIYIYTCGSLLGGRHQFLLQARSSKFSGRTNTNCELSLTNPPLPSQSPISYLSRINSLLSSASRGK